MIGCTLGFAKWPGHNSLSSAEASRGEEWKKFSTTLGILIDED
jgi:hypothetical protein